eukprot:307748-Amphidinium_carterae.1
MDKALWNDFTLFAQCRALRFDLVQRYNLQSPDTVPKALLPYVFKRACFTTNRYLRNISAICNFREIVADIKPTTVNKHAIRNNEQKFEALWLGKATSSGEHIVVKGEQWLDRLHSEFDTRATMNGTRRSSRASTSNR